MRKALINFSIQIPPSQYRVLTVMLRVSRQHAFFQISERKSTTDLKKRKKERKEDHKASPETIVLHIFALWRKNPIIQRGWSGKTVLIMELINNIARGHGGIEDVIETTIT